MKNMLLLATVFFPLASPAFAMVETDLQETKEPKRRTITLIADLNNPDPNKTGTLRVYQEPIGRCGRGEFYEPPRDYVYNYVNHRFSFPVQLNEPQLYEFSVSYTPFRTGFLSEELIYTHFFEANIPGGGEDRRIQATLLSIELDSPVSYGSTNERKIKKIYEK